MHSVLEAVAALRTVPGVRHIGREEVADTVHNLGEGEERHIDLAEDTGLAAAHHRVLGHSLVEAGSRPVGGTVDFALVVVVDTADIEAAVRILGVEGLLQDISRRSSAPSVPQDVGCDDRRAVQ